MSNKVTKVVVDPYTCYPLFIEYSYRIGDKYAFVALPTEQKWKDDGLEPLYSANDVEEEIVSDILSHDPETVIEFVRE